MTASPATDACPICVHGASEVVERRERFEIRACAACAHQFARGSWNTNWDAAYSGDTGEVGHGDVYGPMLEWAKQASPELWEASWFVTSAQHQALAMLRTRPGVKRILDIGCGSGWFLALGRRQGFEMMGMDVAAPPIALHAERGFRAAAGGLGDLPADWPSPDVVTMFEVAEHVADPIDLLSSIRQRFPRALVIISVPSSRRWTLLLGGYEEGDYPPHHLHRFTGESLRTLADRAGFRSCEVIFSPPTGREASMLGLRPLARTLLRRPPATEPAPPTSGNRTGRSLHAGIRRQRVKAVLFAPMMLAMRVARRSGLSMLAVLEP